MTNGDSKTIGDELRSVDLVTAIKFALLGLGTYAGALWVKKKFGKKEEDD